jgi:hypothetical protein
MGFKTALAHYGKQNLLAFDQFLNTLIGGWSDETLSSVAHRMRVKGQPVWGWTANTIDWLVFWEEDHCESSYYSELARGHLPPHMRTKP